MEIYLEKYTLMRQLGDIDGESSKEIDVEQH